MWRAFLRILGVLTPAERIVRKAFRARNLQEIAWTTLAADEPSRFVVGVFFVVDTIPATYRFFAVDKATMKAEELDDCAAYAPKNWR